jgi:hypothetical protein
VNALGKFLALAAFGLAALPVSAPAQRGPNVLIVGTDTDKNAVPRGTPALDSVQETIAGQLRSRGFHVFDETVISKSALPGGVLPREPSELIEAAKLANTPIDVIVITQMSVSTRQMQMVSNAYKPSINVTARMTKVRNGESVGRYAYGDDIDLPVVPGSCATSPECLFKVVGDGARMIGMAVGNAVATMLAADIR